MAKDRLERSWDFDEGSGPIMYYLDLISYRQISNEIAERLKVYHESPQLILIKSAEAIYDASHNYISITELKEALN
jgi:bacillithiol system protein YtxJ